MSEWISVKDDLPEDDKAVIVTDGKIVYVGGYGFQLERGNKFKKSWYIHNGDWDGMPSKFAATHWMPLPKPTTEE